MKDIDIKTKSLLVCDWESSPQLPTPEADTLPLIMHGDLRIIKLVL